MKTFTKLAVLALFVMSIIAATAQVIPNSPNNYLGPTIIPISLGVPAASNGVFSANSIPITNKLFVAGKDLACQVVAQSTGTCTSNLVAYIDRSVDGVNWDTIGGYSNNVAACNTVTTNMVVNWTGFTWPWVRFRISTTALGTVPLTNSYLSVWSK